MLRDFFLGFVKIHILRHAAQEPLYGAAIIAELRRYGYDLSPGALYPLLHG
jgi:DNA-binding PadR family transcriptional regulator